MAKEGIHFPAHVCVGTVKARRPCGIAALAFTHLCRINGKQRA